jgi:hypothetical protein
LRYVCISGASGDLNDLWIYNADNSSVVKSSDSSNYQSTTHDEETSSPNNHKFNPLLFGGVAAGGIFLGAVIVVLIVVIRRRLRRRGYEFIKEIIEDSEYQPIKGPPHGHPMGISEFNKKFEIKFEELIFGEVLGKGVIPNRNLFFLLIFFLFFLAFE